MTTSGFKRPRTSRFLALAVALVLAVLASGCRPGQTMWNPCTPGTDPTGTDGTWVLICRNGVWEPIMTVGEFIALKQGKPIAPAPPSRPELIATYSSPVGTCNTIATAADKTQIFPCHAVGDSVAFVTISHHVGNCGLMGTLFRNFTSVRGTATQGNKTIQLTELNYDFTTAGTMMWRTFDVNHGPITVVINSYILDSPLKCS